MDHVNSTRPAWTSLGVIPWSPLARGRLARDWADATERSRTDEFGRRLHDHSANADRKVVEAVTAVAAQRGVPRAQAASAWVLAKPVVSAPIIGASKPGHLNDALAALDIRLTDEEIGQLESAYVRTRWSDSNDPKVIASARPRVAHPR